MKKKSQNCKIKRYIDIKLITTEYIDATSDISVIHKVLMWRRKEKKIDQRI